MKKFTLIVSLLFFVASGNVWGQFFGGPPMMFGMGAATNEEGDSIITPPTPAEVATQIADTLNTLLTLDAKQYKKVYKLALKEQRKVYNDSINDMMPDFGNFERREFGGMGGGGFSSTPEEQAAEKLKKQKKTAQNRDKEMKKILTQQQYAYYVALDRKVIFRVKEVKNDKKTEK